MFPSSCSLPTVLAGRRPIGVDQLPGGGDDYPLVRPSSDIAGLLADFHLLYRPPASGFRPPFRIDWLYGFGCAAATIPVSVTHDHDLVVVDDAGSVVFDSRNAVDYRAVDWTERLRLVRWTTSTAVAAVTYHTGNSPEDPDRYYPLFIKPQNAILDERAVRNAARSVRRICVEGTQDCVEGDSLILRAGYNVRLETAELNSPFGRKRTAVILHVVPGSGLGRWPADCSQQTQAILRIAGVPPDPQGRFLLTGDPCFRIEPPVVSVQGQNVTLNEHALALNDDCLPCGTCDDYVAVYEAERRLRDKLAALNARRLALRDRYVANLQRFAESGQCRSRDRLRIILEAECPRLVGVAVGYCNWGTQTISNLRLTVSFSGSTVSGTPKVIPSSVFRSGNVRKETGAYTGRHRPRMENYSIQGSWPTYWADFDCVEPGAMASFTFRLQVPPALTPYQAQIAATGSVNVAGQDSVSAQTTMTIDDSTTCS